MFFLLHIIGEGLVLGYNAPNFQESLTAKMPAHLKFMMAKQKYVQYLNLKNNYDRFITCDICVFVITQR